MLMIRLALMHGPGHIMRLHHKRYESVVPAEAPEILQSEHFAVASGDRGTEITFSP